jgi:hypothetical protein
MVAMGYKVLGEKKDAVEANFCLICRHVLVLWGPGAGTESAFQPGLDIPAVQGIQRGTAIATGRVVPWKHLGHW